MAEVTTRQQVRDAIATIGDTAMGDTMRSRQELNTAVTCALRSLDNLHEEENAIPRGKLVSEMHELQLELSREFTHCDAAARVGEMARKLWNVTDTFTSIELKRKVLMNFMQATIGAWLMPGGGDAFDAECHGREG